MNANRLISSGELDHPTRPPKRDRPVIDMPAASLLQGGPELSHLKTDCLGFIRLEPHRDCTQIDKVVPRQVLEFSPRDEKVTSLRRLYVVEDTDYTNWSPGCIT